MHVSRVDRGTLGHREEAEAPKCGEGAARATTLIVLCQSRNIILSYYGDRSSIVFLPPLLNILISLTFTSPSPTYIHITLRHRTTSHYNFHTTFDMGLLEKYRRAPPTTSIDPVKGQNNALPLDLEKNHVQGSEIESTTPSHEHHVLPSIEKKVVRKMDFRIVPLVTALYVLAFLDRSNIGKCVVLEPLFPFSTTS